MGICENRDVPALAVSVNSSAAVKKKFFNSKRKTITFILLFLLPAIVLFGVIYAYPLVTIFYTSFCKWDYTNIANPEFLGWDNLFFNYKYIFFENVNFHTSILNSLKWVCTGLGIQLVMALVTALILSQKCFGWKVVRNVFMIPNIISAAATCIIFLNLYKPGTGIANDIIRLFDKNWDAGNNMLLTPNGAFWGVTLAYVFYGGSSSILIMAKIFSIPNEIFEAASIDGASRLRATFSITMPLIKGTIGTVAILIANSSFLIYNEVALIAAGGPGGSAYSLSYLIKSLSISNKSHFDWANTVGVIQFIIGICIVGGLNRIFRADKLEF